MCIGWRFKGGNQNVTRIYPRTGPFATRRVTAILFLKKNKKRKEKKQKCTNLAVQKPEAYHTLIYDGLYDIVKDLTSN